MHQSFKKILLHKQNIEKSPKHSCNLNYHQEKSLKQLILKKPKHNLIEKIQSQLMLKFNMKVSDKKLFELACFVSHYQTLNSLINSNLNNISASIQRFKNLSNTSPQKSHKNKFTIQSERACHTNFVKTISQSYRFRCLQQFFQIENYGEDNIINTIANKIHQKVSKGQIKTLDNMASTRRISIMNHRRQPSNENNKQQKLNIYSKNNSSPQNISNVKNNKQLSQNQKNNCKYILPKINILKSVQRQNKGNKQNKTQIVSPRQFKNHQIQNINQKVSPLVTLKSFKGQSRRNGIHEVNRILNQMQQLKEKLKNEFSTGEDVMKMASSLKYRLNQLFCNLKVKMLTKAEYNNMAKLR